MRIRWEAKDDQRGKDVAEKRKKIEDGQRITKTESKAGIQNERIK